MSLIVLLMVGTILVADHVVVASDHAPTVARSSPQVTANRTLAATSTLAAHDKSGNEVRAISIQKPAAGANTPPWRPPVVNISYFGGPVMSKPIRVHLIWYVYRSLLHRLRFIAIYMSRFYINSRRDNAKLTEWTGIWMRDRYTLRRGPGQWTDQTTNSDSLWTLRI